jgi:Tfp pilus assembly protein PilF
MLRLRHTLARLALCLVPMLLSQGPTVAQVVGDELVFQQAAKLLQPFILMPGRVAKDAASERSQSEIAEGMRLLEVLVTINPQHWRAYWLKGKVHQATKDHQAAHAAFGQSHQLHTGQADVVREYMIECICIGRTNQAVALAELAVQLRSSDPGLRANLGLAYLADGQFPRAHAATELALQMAPDDGISKGLLDEIKAVMGGRKPANYCPS